MDVEKNTIHEVVSDDMIVLYTGKPGSGKSYKCVNDIMSPEINGKRYVFHNIDGLRRDKFRNPEMIRDWRDYVRENGITTDDFFSTDYQKGLSEQVQKKYNTTILLIIDEAYNWLDRSKPMIREWMAYHRHLGQDIYVIAQRDMMIAADYRALVEYEIRAKHSSIINIPYIFMYQKLANGESCGIGWCVKKKSVFDAYKSFNIRSKSEQIPWKLPAIIGVFTLAVAGWVYSAQNMLGDKYSRGSEQEKRVEVKKEVNIMKMEVKNERGWNKGMIGSADELIKGYIYKGRMGEKVLVENKATGVIYDLAEIVPEIVIMLADRNYVKYYDPMTKRQYRIYHGKSEALIEERKVKYNHDTVR